MGPNPIRVKVNGTPNVNICGVAENWFREQPFLCNGRPSLRLILPVGKDFSLNHERVS